MNFWSSSVFFFFEHPLKMLLLDARETISITLDIILLILEFSSNFEIDEFRCEIVLSS